MTPPLAITSAVAHVLGYSVSDLLCNHGIDGIRRGRARARRIAWLVTVDVTGMSYAEIGALYGGRSKQAIERGVRLESARMAERWTRETVAAVMERIRA